MIRRIGVKTHFSALQVFFSFFNGFLELGNSVEHVKSLKLARIRYTPYKQINRTRMTACNREISSSWLVIPEIRVEINSSQWNKCPVMIDRWEPILRVEPWVIAVSVYDVNESGVSFAQFFWVSNFFKRRTSWIQTLIIIIIHFSNLIIRWNNSISQCYKNNHLYRSLSIVYKNYLSID